MLVLIYSASLIALSSSMALERQNVWPDGQIKCRLFLYVNAVEKGWIKHMDDGTLTAMGSTGPDSKNGYLDATEFLWGNPLGVQNGKFPTLKIANDDSSEQKEIAYDVKTKQSLTLQKRDLSDYIGASWMAPFNNDIQARRPTEIVLENLNTKVQYCTSRDKKTAILRAASGDKNYDCANALLIARFIFKGTADTFPQIVKIGLYRIQDQQMTHVGWLGAKLDNQLYYGDDQNGLFRYDHASQFTLKEPQPGKITIDYQGRTLRKTKTSDPNGNVPAIVNSFGLYADDNNSATFEWANSNRHQIVPTGAETLYHCDNLKDLLKPTFYEKKPDPLPAEWGCYKTMWIISVIG
jgi:hypothetical protein